MFRSRAHTSAGRTRSSVRPLLRPLPVLALALSAWTAGPAAAQCTTDSDCAAQGKICVDGDCVRPGVRNPLDAFDRNDHLPTRADHELFWVGRGLQPPKGFVLTPDEAFLSPDVLERPVVASAAGRIWGTSPQQIALVYGPRPGDDPAAYELVVHEPMTVARSGRLDFSAPAIARYPFRIDPANPHVDVAVGDLDHVREAYPSDEYHDEVALVFQDPTAQRPRVVVLSFENVVPGVPKEYGPAQVTSVVPVLDLPKTGDPSHLAVTTGNFLPTGPGETYQKELAVGGFDLSSNEVLVYLYEVLVESDGQRRLRLADTPDGGPGGLANINTNQPNRAFDLIGGNFDNLTGVADATNNDQLVIASIAVGSGFFKARAYTVYDRPSGWSWESPAAARYAVTTVAVHGPSGDAVQPKVWSRLKLSRGRFPGAAGSGNGWGQEQICATYDTNYGPVMQVIGFSTEAGAPTTGPIYAGQPLLWPKQAELDARSERIGPTLGNAIGGNFVHYRSETMSPHGNRGRARIYYSYPEEGIPLTHGYVFSDGSFGAGSGVVLDENGMPIDEPLTVMLAVDVDGDSGYKRFTTATGNQVYSGQGTRFSFSEITTVESALQEPPKHIDFLPPGLGLAYSGLLNISQLDDFKASYTSSSSTTETFEKGTETDVVFSEASSLSASGEVSAGVEGNSATIEASTEQTVKDAHANSTGYFVEEQSTVTLTSIAETTRDDQLNTEAQSFDTWRFPAMGVVPVDPQGTPLPQSQRPENPTFEITFPGPPVSREVAGRDSDAYQPTHINGNVLGYPSYDLGAYLPGDVGAFTELEDTDNDGVPDSLSSNQPTPGDPLWANQTYVVGNSTTSATLQYSTSDGATTHSGSEDRFKTSSNYTVGGSVEASYGYASASASVQQSYTTKNSHSLSRAKTSSNTASVSAEIGLDIVPILVTDFAYGIAPVWYYTEGGGVALTHAVSTTAGGSGFVWDSTYSRPDPALNLPHRIVFDGASSSWKLNNGLKRKKMKGLRILDENGSDVQFLVPEAGQSLTLVARVYNLSTVTTASNVRVAFEAQETTTGPGGVLEVGPRLPIGEDVVPCIATHGDLSSCSIPPQPDAPNNMGLATVTWNTTGFGSGSHLTLRDWRIYVVLDPNDEIPDETHELDDRFTDPLLDGNGMPMADGLEKGQNNTGWTAISIAEPIVSPTALLDSLDPPDVSIPGFGAEAVGPRGRALRKREIEVGESVRLRFQIQSDVVQRPVSIARWIETDPSGHERVLTEEYVWGLDARGRFVEVDWTPSRPGRYGLRALVNEPVSDRAPGNATTRLEFLVHPATKR